MIRGAKVCIMTHKFRLTAGGVNGLCGCSNRKMREMRAAVYITLYLQSRLFLELHLVESHSCIFHPRLKHSEQVQRAN